jgi:histidinol-phosphate aminotransferase
MSQFWSPILRDLKPYTPGEQPREENLIKLNTNENPYPPSPRVIAAIQANAADSLRRYPDPDGTDLRKTLAHYYHVKPENVFVGNGSDEVLGLAFLAFFRQKNPVLFPDITYSFYPVYARFFEIDYREIPVTENFDIDLMDYRKPNGGIVFANPNALTGKSIPLPQIEALLAENTDSAVIVDEAYVDFGGESAVGLTGKYPNLLVVQTLSKARSLAGLRVGFAVGSQELTAGLEKAKHSFNSYPLDRLALAGAEAAFEDDAWFQENRNRVISTRERVTRKLAEMGFSILPSKANFICVEHIDIPAETLFLGLRAHNILVRYFNAPRVNNFLRITIGSDPEMDRFLEISAKLTKP